VRAGRVVVGDLHSENLLQVPWSQDEEPVQAFSEHRPHPPLGNRVRLGRSNRGLPDTHMPSTEHCVEGGSEFGIPVMNRDGRLPLFLVRLAGPLRACCDAAGRARRGQDGITIPSWRER
jgi:hypothetical protein